MQPSGLELFAGSRTALASCSVSLKLTNRAQTQWLLCPGIDCDSATISVLSSYPEEVSLTQFRTARYSDIGHAKKEHDIALLAGRTLRWNFVTIAGKPGPPPRAIQKRSGFCFALQWTSSPSAVTAYINGYNVSTYLTNLELSTGHYDLHQCRVCSVLSLVRV